MEIKDIVSEMGFDIVDGPEVEYVKYNFDDLNIPKTHPSRELTDTFYIKDDVVLRTQTSGMQIRYMKDKVPPFRMISVGKVYRPDYDVSHTPMFHQVEGLMIGEDVSFANFKAVLESIVKKIFGRDRNVRFRPHFFHLQSHLLKWMWNVEFVKERVAVYVKVQVGLKYLEAEW